MQVSESRPLTKKWFGPRLKIVAHTVRSSTGVPANAKEHGVGPCGRDRHRHRQAQGHRCVGPRDLLTHSPSRSFTRFHYAHTSLTLHSPLAPLSPHSSLHSLARSASRTPPSPPSATTRSDATAAPTTANVALAYKLALAGDAGMDVGFDFDWSIGDDSHNTFFSETDGKFVPRCVFSDLELHEAARDHGPPRLWRRARASRLRGSLLSSASLLTTTASPRSRSSSTRTPTCPPPSSRYGSNARAGRGV